MRRGREARINIINYASSRQLLNCCVLNTLKISRRFRATLTESNLPALRRWVSLLAYFNLEYING